MRLARHEEGKEDEADDDGDGDDERLMTATRNERALDNCGEG